jgi:beta-galactosidase
VDSNDKTYYAYGGDFGEERGVHGGNFVCDGLLFPDRTPSPALLQVKRVFEPVVLSVNLVGGKPTLTVRNKHAFVDTSYLGFTWRLEASGADVASGHLDVRSIPAGDTRSVELPSLGNLDRSADAEYWWTISAVTAKRVLWANAGHEVAWTQYRDCVVQEGCGNLDSAQTASNETPTVRGGLICLGAATFDARYGHLLTLGSTQFHQAKLDTWRAPTDNDRGNEMLADWPGVLKNYETIWRVAGLDRMQHRVDSIEAVGSSLEVTMTVGPAVLDRYLKTTYRYESRDRGGAIGIQVTILPVGDWTDLPLPRFGMLFSVDPCELQDRLEHVSWFGCGPGEAYPDSRAASRIGRYDRAIAQMQTPYVMPQENGSRIDVRHAEVVDAQGRGLRFEGAPSFALSVRHWSTEALDRARRMTDLVAGERTYINVDYAQSGLGSASCGPGVLPEHRINLEEGKAISFNFVLRSRV